MDRQARKLHRGAEDGGAGSDAASDMGSNSDSENEEKVFDWKHHNTIFSNAIWIILQSLFILYNVYTTYGTYFNTNNKLILQNHNNAKIVHLKFQVVFSILLFVKHYCKEYR